MTKNASQSRKIQDSHIALGEKKSVRQIDSVMISEQSGVAIGEITSIYDSVEDIFWDVVSGHKDGSLERDDGDDSVHDKLFDLLMRRFEALHAVKQSLQNLSRDFDEKDFQALFVKEKVVRNMGWVLASAGVSTSGLEGEARKRALAWVFGKSFDKFIKEEDRGLPKTMMTLDRTLTRASQWQSRMNGAVTLAKGAGAVLASFIDRLREGREKTTASPEEASKPDQKITD